MYKPRDWWGDQRCCDSKADFCYLLCIVYLFKVHSNLLSAVPCGWCFQKMPLGSRLIGLKTSQNFRPGTGPTRRPKVPKRRLMQAERCVKVPHQFLQVTPRLSSRIKPVLKAKQQPLCLSSNCSCSIGVCGIFCTAATFYGFQQVFNSFTCRLLLFPLGLRHILCYGR